jgi:hypothetical protein
MICSSDGHRDIIYSSLLWSVVATGADITVPVAAVSSSSDRRLLSLCPLLLGVTTAMDNLISD